MYKRMTANGIANKKLPCNTICNVIKCWQWDISPFIENVKQNSTKYAVVILNRPLTQKQDFVKSLWNNATVRVTVDGGTTHWNNFYKSLANEDKKNIRLPDLITGDFDSITQDVLQEFKKKGCKAVHTPDQNHTDFTKALIELNNYNEQHKTELDHIVTLGQNSGRIDQILGNIQTLFLVREMHILPPKTNVYIMSDDTVSWLLSPGDHVIFVPEETRTFKRSWCSLVPVGESCDAVTTSGLKWNLNNQPLKFGSLVSTSNTFDRSEVVKIKCSHTLLWSMRVPSLTEKQR
ncbi:thiamin pyrophosphokinase 1 isoform X1 [Pieris napi]|uniref:thiamin pyrophosphokinase 1 isoform X1 n=1 Tax=Pieris napi TaxID=78633 RepID=UPI001FBBFC77|nr:thiamin pyrophosphokinase 1 isoform X1 [Pieris napi]